MSPLLIPVFVLSGIGLVLAALLVVGRKVFYVEVDERQEKLMEILPGANCGGCGFPGCSGYAAALVSGNAEPTKCPPGGAELAGEIGRLLGVEVGDVTREIACVACAGDVTHAEDRVLYKGVEDCTAAHLLAGGPKKCTYGCLGLGSCKNACAFNAIVITDSGIAYVDSERCTGCGQCVEACPRGLIAMVPADAPVHVLCKNPNKAKRVKAVCEVGCTGCKACTKRSKGFEMTGALASVNHRVEGSIPEEAALACPQGAILDTRHYTLAEWIESKAARSDFETRKESWKAEEKAKKAAAKERKAKAKGTSEEKKLGAEEAASKPSGGE